MSVYAVAIESNAFTPEPLRKLAAETGGTYYAAASSEALAGVYATIAQELRRTWQVRYFTASRPGESLSLEASVGADKATSTLKLPGVLRLRSDPSRPDSCRPRSSTVRGAGRCSASPSAVLVLLAAVLLFSVPRGSRLRARIAPHIGDKPRPSTATNDRDRLAIAAGLFRVTERTFAHQKLLEALRDRCSTRGDVPLRTVELLYVMPRRRSSPADHRVHVGPPFFLLLPRSRSAPTCRTAG